jgi:hypothetical protein
VDWIDVAQVRDQWRALVNALKYLKKNYIYIGQFLSSCKASGCSRRAQLHGVSLFMR